MSFSKDERILRDLAAQLAEISKKDIQDYRRDLWRKHNSLKATRPPILVNVGPWDVLGYEILTEGVMQCEDPFLRKVEFELRACIFKDTLGDDCIIEPWFKVPAHLDIQGWGVNVEHKKSEQTRGAYKFSPPIKDEEDIKKLITPGHKINEEKTMESYERVANCFGDILTVVVDRTTVFKAFLADISYWITQLLGLEEIMYYMYDRSEWMHKLLGFMRDGILKVHEEAEKAGDWTLLGHINQAMPYSEELPDPAVNSGSVGRSMLWGFFASQEFTLISPEMQDEFLLQYQIPIMEKMGLIAYGCCEDLTRKIGILRKIPNLRRIAVAPWADIASCAEQIQHQYVISWRPNPALMVCTDWDPQRIRSVVKDALDVSRGCIVDITLKDVQTVRNEVWRLKEWVNIVRDVAEEYV